MIPDKLIIVTQAHVRFGFNVAKSLTHAGYRVIAAAPQVPTMCAGMRGVVREIRYPDPFCEPLGYIKAISDVHAREGASLFIPVHEDIFVASLLRQFAPPDLTILAPPFDVLMALHDKYSLFQLTCKDPLGCPPTRQVSSCIDVLDALDQLGAPLVLKPRFGEGAAGIFKLRSAAEVRRRKAALNALLAGEPYLAQRFSPGVGVGVGMLVLDDRVLATSQHLRLREVPLSGGTSTARLTYHDDRLQETTRQLLFKARLNGIAMAEFRVDPRSRQAHLLDLNPRYWGGLSCHVESGVDYPVVHVRAFWEQQVPAQTIVPVRQVESRWALGEIRSCLALLMRGRWRDVAGMILPRHGTTVIYEDLSSDETRAFWVQTIAYARRVLQAHRVRGNFRRSSFFHDFAEIGADGLLARIMGSGVPVISDGSGPNAASRPD